VSADSRSKYLRLGEGQRDGGVIVTAQHDDGRLRTLHIPGPSRAALREVCEQIDEMGEGWFIAAISTPRTIYRDLQDARSAGGGRGHMTTGRDNRFMADPRPELIMLDAVGRRDLLRPRGAS